MTFNNFYAATQNIYVVTHKESKRKEKVKIKIVSISFPVSTEFLKLFGTY